MAYVTTGLAHGGRTEHYQFKYDGRLSHADGRDRANALIGVCERDFDLMSAWFGGIDLTVPTPIDVLITRKQDGGAGWGPPISLDPGDGKALTYVRYLLAAEVTEMFMMAQNRGWFGVDNEGSAGESLSRFLADQLLVTNGLGVTETVFARVANAWMTSPRNDYVNHVDPFDHAPDEKTGCGLLFIYYLSAQLGFEAKKIVAAAAPELAGVYRHLTGDDLDPFPSFKGLLDRAFPWPKPIPGTHPDNPFPLRLDPFPGVPLAETTWGTIRTGHELVPLGGNRVLDWEPATGHVRIWRYDPAFPDPLPGVPLVEHTWSTIRTGHQLVSLGDNRVLDFEHGTGHARIWRYDPTVTGTGDPFPGDPVVEHTWSTIGNGHALVPLGSRRVLDWEPTTSHCRVWRYDPTATGSADPFPGDPVVEHTWSTIGVGHQLIPLGGNRVLDWERATGRARVWVYGPLVTGSRNPFAPKPLADHTWSSIRTGHELVPVGGDHVLDWEPATGHVRVWLYSR